MMTMTPPRGPVTGYPTTGLIRIINNASAAPSNPLTIKLAWRIKAQKAREELDRRGVKIAPVWADAPADELRGHHIETIE